MCPSRSRKVPRWPSWEKAAAARALRRSRSRVCFPHSGAVRGRRHLFQGRERADHAARSPAQDSRRRYCLYLSGALNIAESGLLDSQPDCRGDPSASAEVKDVDAEIVHWLKTVGIVNPEKRMHDYPHQLSGGMQQRAMIAMALSCRPSLLVADEPTTALDVTIQAQILAELKRLRAEFNMSLILITHNIAITQGLCDRMAVMFRGESSSTVTRRAFCALRSTSTPRRSWPASRAWDQRKSASRRSTIPNSPRNREVRPVSPPFPRLLQSARADSLVVASGSIPAAAVDNLGDTVGGSGRALRTIRKRPVFLHPGSRRGRRHD